MKTSLFRAFGIVLAAALLTGIMAAQESGERMVFVQKADAGMKSMNVTAFAPQGGTYTFIAAETGMEGKVVKGSPYSAEGVTETERTLADGTRITKKTTSKIYRDSQGRTRREMTLGAVGPWSAEGEAATTITINDPVSGRMYVMHEGSSKAKAIDVLHPHSNVEIEQIHGEPPHKEVKIIRKKLGDGEMHAEHEVDVNVTATSSGSSHVWVHKEHSGGSGHTVSVHDFSTAGKKPFLVGEGDAKTEDLGERNIEGVVAKGTKTSHTIPEGKIGNDRPITITSEKWYSEELGTVVMSKTTDPMAGNTTYRLTNISRAEPPPSLFKIDETIELHEGHTIQRQ